MRNADYDRADRKTREWRTISAPCQRLRPVTASAPAAHSATKPAHEELAASPGSISKTPPRARQQFFGQRLAGICLIAAADPRC
jgi:hypothetical protein